MANETDSYTDPNALLLLALVDPPRSSQVRDDVVRQALSRLAHKRSYDRLGRVLLHSDYDTLRSLLLVLQARDALEMGMGDGYEREIKIVAPLPRDETFERICELAADVITWECGYKQETLAQLVDVEFDRYVRPAWLAFTDEVEYELEGLDLAERFDCDCPGCWPAGHVRHHSRKELLDMSEAEGKFSAFDKQK
jgi:hypothetical protein